MCIFSISFFFDLQIIFRFSRGLKANVDRLKLYKSKLLVFPKGSGKKAVKKGDTARSELQNVAQNTLKEIIPVPKPTLRVKSLSCIRA